MRSVTIACAAVAATMSTLAGVAVFMGAPDLLLGRAYDRGLNAAVADGGTRLFATANESGTEHFWLTKPATAAGVQLTPTLNVPTSVSLAEIKRAISTATSLHADRLEVLSVRDIMRATLGTDAPATKSLLVTAKISANSAGPARVFSFVIDGAEQAAVGSARAL